MIKSKPAPVTLPVTDQAVITGTGLTLPEFLEFEDWLLLGRKLMLADKAIQWAIGDWWVYGDHRYGERAAAAIDPVSGKNRLQRFMNYGWVARRIETSRRKEVLSWSAHEAVAPLEPHEQDMILDKAVENGWGSREIRAAVKEYRNRLAGKHKVIEVEEAEVVSEEDADKAVMDQTPVGQAMAHERPERADFEANDEAQGFLRFLASGKKVDFKRVPLDSFKACDLSSLIYELADLERRKARHDQDYLIPKAAPTEAPVQSGAQAPSGESEGAGASDGPAHRHSPVIPPVGEPSARTADLPAEQRVYERDWRGVEQPPDIPEFLRVRKSGVSHG